MDKNMRAKTPPMGWNSWDCYGAAVKEEEIKGNADYMAKNMKEFGWEYVVCDIQWYEPTASSSVYNKFVPLEMDEYARLIPAENRFPSAANGKGFKPLADYIHDLGLKFGIHIMRGIPRQAAHNNTPIKGTTTTARQIAQSFSVCSWNTDMYGVDASVYGAQEYYNSIFELYAQWGVDFVKVDDICVTEFKPHDLYSAKAEIELIRNAINNCGRDMVLSLSPGPALVEQAEHLSENANMWRMTGDFWDRWSDLYGMFERCNIWSPYVKEGCWPDCDMLPLGHVGIKSIEHGMGDRYTNFTKDEQITLMTLWCIFRSPLFMGGELRDNDEWTLKLLTNKEVLSLLSNSFGAKQISNMEDTIVWKSRDKENNVYVGAFNTGSAQKKEEITFDKLEIKGKYKARDMWKQKDIGECNNSIVSTINPHGAVLYKLSKV